MNLVSRVVALATAAIFCVSGMARAETLPATGMALTVAVAPVVEGLTSAFSDGAIAPAKTLADSLPDLVNAHMGAGVVDAEHECLAGAVYFEAKGEPLKGQLAVAEVILNRVSSGRYPPTVCGVVKQKSQFSFVRGGRIPPVLRDSEAWRKAVAVAHVAKADLSDGGVGKAMFFHARYVSPGWRNLTRVASIGNHIFYSH